MPVPDTDPKGFDFNYIEIKSESRVVSRIRRSVDDIVIEFDDGVTMVVFAYNDNEEIPRLAVMQGNAESLTPEYIESIKSLT